MPDLTPNHIEAVQNSWKQVLPIADTAADLFYGKLFELDPALKPLFKSDMGEQKKKLMQMLGAAVNGLSDVEALIPVVQDLGQRHSGYGVQESHYATVGAALLWTLEQGLGDGYTDEVQAGWTAVYETLSSVMIAASA